jgi:hypothetical protein
MLHSAFHALWGAVWLTAPSRSAGLEQPASKGSAPGWYLPTGLLLSDRICSSTGKRCGAHFLRLPY